MPRPPLPQDPKTPNLPQPPPIPAEKKRPKKMLKIVAVSFTLGLLAGAASAQQLQQQPPPPKDIKPTIELSIDQNVALYKKRLEIDKEMGDIPAIKKKADDAIRDMPEYQALSDVQAKIQKNIDDLKKQGAEIIAEDKRRQGITTPLWYDWRTNKIVDYDPEAPAPTPKQQNFPHSDPPTK